MYTRLQAHRASTCIALALAVIWFALAKAQAQNPITVAVGSAPKGVAIDPISNVAIVANSGDDTVSVVDLSSQKVTATITGITSPAGVAVSALGLAVVANRSSNSVTVVDLATRRVRSVIQVGAGPAGVAVNANTNTAVVANSLSYSLSLVDLGTLQQVAVVEGIPSPNGIQSVAIDPDLNVAAVASSGTNSLFIVDLSKRQITAKILVGASPSGVAIDRASKIAAVANQGSSSVSLVDLRTNSVTATISGITEPQAVTISAGTRSAVLTTGRNATLEIVNLITGGLENTISSLPGASGVAFNPATGATVVALSDTNSAAIIPSLRLVTVVNSASFVSGPVAPSSIASGFGAALAGGTAGATGVPLPTALLSVSVRVNNISAPLFFVSPQQINFQVPALAPGNYKIQVLNGGQQVASGALAVALASPGFFCRNQQGTGQAAALNEDNRPNGSQPPPGAETNALPGHPGEIIQLFGTGGGFTNPDPPAGSAAAAAAPTLASPTVQVGGLPAQVLYSGASPGLVGIWQLNVRIPANVTLGPAVPVVATVNGRPANTVTIVVQ